LLHASAAEEIEDVLSWSAMMKHAHSIAEFILKENPATCSF